jgi:hypothetical protein
MRNLMQRYEKKYLLNKQQYQSFLSFVRQYVDEDIHHINHEPYFVETTYFDDDTHTLVRHSLSSPAYKEKLRVRTYNQNITFLELKKKFLGQSYKLRISLNHVQKEQLLHLDTSFFEDTMEHKELLNMFSKHALKPVVDVSYYRYAFEDASIGLRITLDHDISYHYYGANKEDLFEHSYILEIKCHLAFPLWLSKYLSENRLHHQSLSKYGLSYFEQLKGTHYVIND